jgi:Thioesterase-like superfamily
LDPATTGFAAGQPAGIGELRAWVGFADGRPPDPLSMLLFGDCLPPPSFDLPQVAFSWVPTMQLSVFVRAVPAPGSLVVRSVARSVGAGAMDETCDVWDSSGRHVAVAHQLAAVRPA